MENNVLICVQRSNVKNVEKALKCVELEPVRINTEHLNKGFEFSINCCLLIIQLYPELKLTLTKVLQLKQMYKVPVVGIIDSCNPDDFLDCFQITDECMLIPFNIYEFAARAKRLISSSNLHEISRRSLRIISSRNLHIIKEHRQVFYKEKHIHLTRGEFDILYLLASRPGIVFTREDIFAAVWKEIFVPHTNYRYT